MTFPPSTIITTTTTVPTAATHPDPPFLSYVTNFMYFMEEILGNVALRADYCRM